VGAVLRRNLMTGHLAFQVYTHPPSSMRATAR
jgi:hypothetical protein